ncbi:MAG: hypothetical protein KDC85_14825 [Saprospiraceae bacterium]|nr:hypothetical protein [Saprospiraceae bacterium]MCB9323828.1 hypothetical protein [Lewinellaceae bacterium]
MNKTITTGIMLFIFLGTLTAGGPWPQKKGQGYFKLSEWWVVFDQHYTDEGLIDPNLTTGIFNTAVYAEYGLTDRLTGIVNAPLFSRNYMNNLISRTTGEVLVKGEAINGLGDIDVGLKYGLTKPGARFLIAASVFFGIPTGITGGGTFENLQTGDGEFNQMVQIDAGTSLNFGKKVAGYTSAYVGFNNRTKEYSEEFRFGVELGAGFFNQKLWVTGRVGGIESFKNGATAASNNSTTIFANNTEYISFSLETNYYMTKRVGVSAAFAGAWRGEIIAARPSYSVGIFYDMSK